jgi:hypothetical protein
MIVLFANSSLFALEKWSDGRRCFEHEQGNGEKLIEGNKLSAKMIPFPRRLHLSLFQQNVIELHSSGKYA